MPLPKVIHTFTAKTLASATPVELRDTDGQYAVNAYVAGAVDQETLVRVRFDALTGAGEVYQVLFTIQKSAGIELAVMGDWWAAPEAAAGVFAGRYVISARIPLEAGDTLKVYARNLSVTGDANRTGQVIFWNVTALQPGTAGSDLTVANGAANITSNSDITAIKGQTDKLRFAGEVGQEDVKATLDGETVTAANAELANLDAKVSERATPGDILTTPANKLATDEDGKVTAASAESLGEQALEDIADEIFKDKRIKKCGFYRIEEDAVVTVAGASTATFADGREYADFYANCRVIVTDGAGEGQVRRIVSSVFADGATTLTVARPWLPLLQVGDKLQIEADETTKLSADGLADDTTAAAILEAAEAVNTRLPDSPADEETSAAIAAGQQTLLARLGAFVGTGANTVLGWLRALLSKAATKPSDVGGTFDPATDSAEAIRDALRVAPVTVIQPVSQAAEIRVVAGDSYAAADGRALAWRAANWAGPDLTSAAVELRFQTRADYEAGTGTAALVVAGGVTMDGSDAVVTVELTATQTASLAGSPPEDPWSYIYQVVLTPTTGRPLTPFLGSAQVTARIQP